MYTTCVKKTTAHNVMQMTVFHGDLRLSAPLALMQSVRCSLFGHAIQFNTVHTVIIMPTEYSVSVIKMLKFLVQYKLFC